MFLQFCQHFFPRYFIFLSMLFIVSSPFLQSLPYLSHVLMYLMFFFNYSTYLQVSSSIFLLLIHIFLTYFVFFSYVSHSFFPCFHLVSSTLVLVPYILLLGVSFSFHQSSFQLSHFSLKFLLVLFTLSLRVHPSIALPYTVPTVPTVPTHTTLYPQVPTSVYTSLPCTAKTTIDPFRRIAVIDGDVASFAR